MCRTERLGRVGRREGPRQRGGPPGPSTELHSITHRPLYLWGPTGPEPVEGEGGGEGEEEGEGGRKEGKERGRSEGGREEEKEVE